MIKISDWIRSAKEERQQHLNLEEPCLIRGGDYHVCRGVLAQYLDTDIPKIRNISICHACNNPKCSNPKHLYWGTFSENMHDAYECGDRKKGFAGKKCWELGIKPIPPGTKQPIVQCPTCGKLGGQSAMRRWHFDNCRTVR